MKVGRMVGWLPGRLDELYSWLVGWMDGSVVRSDGLDCCIVGWLAGLHGWMVGWIGSLVG